MFKPILIIGCPGVNARIMLDSEYVSWICKFRNSSSEVSTPVTSLAPSPYSSNFPNRTNSCAKDMKFNYRIALRGTRHVTVKRGESFFPPVNALCGRSTHALIYTTTPTLTGCIYRHAWHCTITWHTGWPRTNATTLIVNFKSIIKKTELIFVSICGKLIFQQNDTMIVNFG